MVTRSQRSDHLWRTQVIGLMVSALAATTLFVVTDPVSRPQLTLVPATSESTPPTHTGPAGFQRLPTPPEPQGEGAWATVCRQPSGTDTQCIETASDCWLNSLHPRPKDTARPLPYSSDRGGDNITPLPVALAGDQHGRSTGNSQLLTELVVLPTLTNRTLSDANATAAILDHPAKGERLNSPAPLAVQLKSDRAHARVLPLARIRMPPTSHQRDRRHSTRTLASLLLLKEKSHGTVLPDHSRSTYGRDDGVGDMTTLILQFLLIAALLTLDKHMKAIIANEALQHALGHTPAAGSSVMPTVITNTLWHCFSHHQWADVGAAVYGCVAAYALTHSAWTSQLGITTLCWNTSVGPKAMAAMSLISAVVFAQAGYLRLLNPRPGSAALVTAAILLVTAPSHGNTITMTTAGMDCQLYMAVCVAAFAAAHALCHSLRQLELAEWRLREQTTARSIAYALLAITLLVASIETRPQLGSQLAQVSVAIPQAVDLYTAALSLTVISLPSVTLRPASAARHQLNESWDESWSIVASGRRTMAPSEAGSRALRKLVRAKHTPDDLRKACREMRQAADECYKAIQQKFEADTERYEAEMKTLMEEARRKQLANPKGAQQPDIPGFRKSCSNATVTIGSVRPQTQKECVLLTAANSQVGPGTSNKNYANKLRQLAGQMQESLFLSGSNLPTDMSEGIDVTMMFVTAPAAKMREGRYVVSSSIILNHKSDAWMGPKLKDAIRKGQSISFCLYDDYTSAPATNESVQQTAGGHAYCIKLRVVLGKRWCPASMQHEKVPVLHYTLIDTDLKDEGERQQALDRVISSTAFTANVLAAYNGDTPAARHPPRYSTHTVHVMAPNKQIRKIQCSPSTTLSAVLHSHYGTEEHRETVMSSLGPLSGATKMSHFGAITGSQDAADRPEGLLMLSTEQPERVRPVALEVPVIVRKPGDEADMHVVYLSQDELESTAADIANIVCGDDYWNVRAVSDAATGSKHLQQPVKFTMPYLQELMGGSVSLIVSCGDTPPVAQLGYDRATGKSTRTDGPPRGSAKGSGRGRANVWGGSGGGDDWSPNNNDDGRRDQPQPSPVPPAPALPAVYEISVIHMASEAQATPWKLPQHHLHDTCETTNRHHASSTATFGDLMQFYNMQPGKCKATSYAGDQIKHSMYGISPATTIGTVAPSGTVLVIWDNASRPEDMATTLWCGQNRERGPRATVAVEYQLAACDAGDDVLQNTIGTIKVGSLTDGNFTNANLQYVCQKVEQWAALHFSKNRFPPPPNCSHLVDVRVFDTFEGVRCEYDRERCAFKPAPPGSDGLVHSTPGQLEVVINLNMQDTQTLLHQHLPNRRLKNLARCGRAEGGITGFHQVAGLTDEEKADMTAAMERIARTTPYSASSLHQVDQLGNTTDRGKCSINALTSRSDTLCVAELLSHDGVAGLLNHGSSPRYFAGVIADWVTARHHQINHNDNKRQVSLYDRDAVEAAKLKLAAAKLKLAAAPAEQPDDHVSQQLTALDLQRVTDDWQYDLVKKTARSVKNNRFLKPFLRRLSLLHYEDMECFDGIFLEAAKQHIQQMTTTEDPQVLSMHRVLTSILIGYQTADAQGYKEWTTALANAEDSKGMMCDLMWQHEMGPAYYMLGWQFAHNRRTLQDAYGPAASCTGSSLQNGDCILAHEHATITETSCASTGWTFLAQPEQPIKVAVGVHVKRKGGIEYRTWLGDGGKPTAMQTDASGGRQNGVPKQFAALCLGERENPMSCKVREGLEETGGLIRPARWILSWLGTGTIGKAWQLMDFSTFLTATDTMALKTRPFAGCEEFVTSMWATHEDILRIEHESDPDFEFGVESGVESRQHPIASTHLLSKRIELGARAAGIDWPGTLERMRLPTVEAIEPEPIPDQARQRKEDMRGPRSREGKHKRKEREADERSQRADKLHNPGGKGGGGRRQGKGRPLDNARPRSGPRAAPQGDGSAYSSFRGRPAQGRVRATLVQAQEENAHDVQTVRQSERSGPLDELTLGVLYDNDYCDDVGQYVTELCPTAKHGEEFQHATNFDFDTLVPSVGWPTHGPPDQPTYSVVTRAHKPDPFREHPLDNVGCDREPVSQDYHRLGNKYIRELRHLIDERTGALSEIHRSMRLPDEHPDALRLQQAVGPNTSMAGDGRLLVQAGANMTPVEVCVSMHGELLFPFKELDEIIGRLIVPAATTMQALSKKGNHKEFRAYASGRHSLPTVRLRVRTLPDHVQSDNVFDSNHSGEVTYKDSIKLELVPPGEGAYEDDIEMQDRWGKYMVAAGYQMQGRRGRPPHCRMLRREDGLTGSIYCHAHVVAALIAHDQPLLRALERFVQDCVHLHLEIWWRTAQIATIKRDHGRDLLARTCKLARAKALGTRIRRLRHHYLWLTLTKPADQLAEGVSGPCLFNATNHGRASIQGKLRSHGPFANIHLDNAYATRAGWAHGWSLHYNKINECWHEEVIVLGHPGQHVADPNRIRLSHLHKALHMGTGRACGALLQAIVESGALVPLPIPGSMITEFDLHKYVTMDPLQPGRGPSRRCSLTYEQAGASTIAAIDDITACMVVTDLARNDAPGYTLGQQTPYEYQVFSDNEPATRRSYTRLGAEPVLLGQMAWPHVYPSNVGVLPLHMYDRFQLMPRQRTSALTNEAPPAWIDANPDDSDNCAEARIREQLIKEHIHYPYDEALNIVARVRAENPRDTSLVAAEKSLARHVRREVVAARAAVQTLGLKSQVLTHRIAHLAGHAPGADAEASHITTCQCANGCDDETTPGGRLCAICYATEGCYVLDSSDEDHEEAFSYVVPGSLDGPNAGSRRPSGPKDPMAQIARAARTSRNPSPTYVEDPDSEVEVDDGLASESNSDGAEAEGQDQSDTPTVLYVCDTGTVYTIGEDYQPVNAGNCLAKRGAGALLLPPPTEYDLQNYALCRENQPHDLFPPCTSCYGALQEDGVICRLDNECPLTALDDMHLCPDCSSSLASCHAQSETECPEPTRAAVRLLRILWSMAVQCRDPSFFFEHYPNVHATDQAWAFSADAIWSTFQGAGMPEDDLKELLLTYATGIDQYSVVSVDTDGLALIRLLGGRRSITREEVDEDLMEQYVEAQAALARASPQKAGKPAKSPSAERAREHFLKQQQANSPARRRRAEARAAWQSSIQTPRSTPTAAQREAALRQEIEALKAAQAQPLNATQPDMAHALAMLTASLAGANANLVKSLQEGRTPEPELEGLISPHAARTAADLYADLLEALDMADHVLQPKPRPPLTVLIDTAGCNPAYPYLQRKGSVLGMAMDGWLDSNMVTTSFVQRERDALKASTISGSDSIGLTTDKNGLLIASQGGKPVLPKAQITKIKTYEEWYAATDNLCHHFDATQKNREYTLLSNHRQSMRNLWLRQHTFEGDHANFLRFEQDLRSTRVSAPDLNPTWTFDDDSRHEQVILNKYLLAVTSARIEATISSRPSKSPGDKAANKGECQTDGCTRRAAGKGKRHCKTCATKGASTPGKGGKGGTSAPRAKCADYTKGSCAKGAACPLRHADDYNSIPQDISTAIGRVQPPICRAFAYTGRCGKSSGDSCQSANGNTLRHVCYQCQFEDGKHAIKDGSCPI